ncbi:Uncharacterised protein [Vibrio cholerae]|nr:Uncharacterised protein [Vibrio cholerae]
MTNAHQRSLCASSYAVRLGSSPQSHRLSLRLPASPVLQFALGTSDRCWSG